MGKGGAQKIKKIILSIATLCIVVFVLLDNQSYAYSSSNQLVNPLNPSKLLPGIPSVNMGTIVPTLSGLPTSLGGFKLFNLNSLSANDFTSALKSIGILAINLFLIVIQVVAGILKALLPFLSR